VRVYHETLNSSIDAAYEYIIEDDENDLVKDDVILPPGYEEEEDNYFGLPGVPDIDEMINAENAKTESDSYHKYVGVDVILPNSADQKLMAKVKKKVKSNDRNDPRFYNPLRDHSLYEIELPDGTTDEVEANLIAECMVSECDPDGRQYRILKEISDHRKNNTALNVADGSYRTWTGNLVPKRTTKGWKLLIEWVDGSMDWVRLAEMKEAYQSK